MGNKQTVFTEDQLDTYQDCTFFTRKEIMRVYERFANLEPDTVPRIMSNESSSSFKLSHVAVENMPEFKENPFKRRICEVFTEDVNGDMSFDEFLDMFSVFSEAAPRDLKAFFAFRIYDFDGDESINRRDMRRTINSLTRNELSEDEVEFICDKVFDEADLDDDEQLNFTEFEHFISRAPDFISNFHVRI